MSYGLTVHLTTGGTVELTFGSEENRARALDDLHRLHRGPLTYVFDGAGSFVKAEHIVAAVVNDSAAGRSGEVAQSGYLDKNGMWAATPPDMREDWGPACYG